MIKTSVKSSVTPELLSRGGKPVPVVPALLGALHCMGTLPFQREPQCELGTVPGELKTVFVEFRPSHS